MKYCEMDFTLSVWRFALPAGPARLVLYNGDTPLQLLVFIHSNEFSFKPYTIDPISQIAELNQ